MKQIRIAVADRNEYKESDKEAWLLAHSNIDLSLPFHAIKPANKDCIVFLQILDAAVLD